MNKILKLCLLFTLLFSFQSQSFACWEEDDDDWFDFWEEDDDDWIYFWTDQDFDDLYYNPIEYFYDPEDGTLTAFGFESELPEFIADGEDRSDDNDDNNEDDIFDINDEDEDEDEDVDEDVDEEYVEVEGTSEGRGLTIVGGGISYGGGAGFSGGGSGGNNNQSQEELASTGKKIFEKMETDLRKGNFKAVKVSIVDGVDDYGRKAQVMSNISNTSLAVGTVDATVGAMQYFKYGTKIANNPFYAGFAKTFGIFGIPVAAGQTILIYAERGSWGNMTTGEQLSIISNAFCAVGVCLQTAGLVFPPLAVAGTVCDVIGVGFGIASLFYSDVPIVIPLNNGKYLVMTPEYDMG